MRYPLAGRVEYPVGSPEAAIPQLRAIGADALIIWGSPRGALSFLRALRASGIHLPVLGTSSLAAPEAAEILTPMDELIVAAPFDIGSPSRGFQDFATRFRSRSGMPPSSVAVYAYDAARLVIKAIETAGLNRVRIRDELAQMSFEGVTGKVQFNSLRANTADPVLMTLREGRWERAR